MATAGNVVVLFNDLSDDVTIDDLDVLLQVDNVSATLRQMGYKVFNLAFSSDDSFIDTLLDINPDFVFNLVEAVSEKSEYSYLAPALLDKLGIRYTGCSAEAIRLTTNKIETKENLKYLSISTPPWVSATRSNGFRPNETYIIKAQYEDASVGINSESVMSFRSAGQLKSLLNRMKNVTAKDFFAEKLIEGREFRISILGENGSPLILAPAEIRFIGYDERNIPKIIDYKAKWETDSFEYQNTFAIHRFEPIDDELLEEVRSISEKCWTYFALSGYASIDIRVDEQGIPWVLEINPNPCITPGESGFVKSAEESGFNFHDIVRKIVIESQNNCFLISK